MKEIKDFVNEFIAMYNDDLTKGLEEGEEKTQARFAFAEIAMELARIALGIGGCGNDECVCQPKNHVSHLLETYADVYKKWMYPDQFDFLYQNFGK